MPEKNINIKKGIGNIEKLVGNINISSNDENEEFKFNDKFFKDKVYFSIKSIANRFVKNIYEYKDINIENRYLVNKIDLSTYKGSYVAVRDYLEELHKKHYDYSMSPMNAIGNHSRMLPGYLKHGVAKLCRILLKVKTEKQYIRFLFAMHSWFEKSVDNMENIIDNSWNGAYGQRFTPIPEKVRHAQNNALKNINTVGDLFTQIEDPNSDLNLSMRNISFSSIDQPIETENNPENDEEPPFDVWEISIKLATRMFVSDINYLIDNIVIFYLHKNILISGEALIGKTHFLCDFVLNKIKNSDPALIFFAKDFLTDNDPLDQAIQTLGLNVKSDIFLDELNKFSENRKRYAYLIFDGINETNNKDVWRNNLASLIERSFKYRNIIFIFSIRDLEKNQIIDINLEKSLYGKLDEIVHKGFEGIEKEALNTFCDVFKVDPPDFPIISRILINPGLLFIYFQTLKDKKINKIDHSIFHPNLIIDNYVQEINLRISKKINLPINRNNIILATNIICENMIANKFSNSVLYEDVFDKISSIHVELLDFIISEGLLLTSYNNFQTHLQFSYQRFGNYFAAIYIFLEIKNKSDVRNNKKILGLINNYKSNKSVLEAIFNICSYKFDINLFEIFPQINDNIDLFKLYVNSHMWSSSSTDEIRIFESLHVYNSRKRILILNVLVNHSVAINSNINALYLHKLLSSYNISKREYLWSVFIGYSFESDGVIKNIISFGLDEESVTSIGDDSLNLYGILLTWMLISTNKKLRDDATQSLINLYINKLNLFIDIMNLFRSCEDPYILERLFVIAYNIIIKSHGNNDILKFGEFIVYYSSFEGNNILIKYYANKIKKYTGAKNENHYYFSKTNRGVLFLNNIKIKNRKEKACEFLSSEPLFSSLVLEASKIFNIEYDEIKNSIITIFSNEFYFDPAYLEKSNRSIGFILSSSIKNGNANNVSYKYLLVSFHVYISSLINSNRIDLYFSDYIDNFIQDNKYYFKNHEVILYSHNFISDLNAQSRTGNELEDCDFFKI